MSKMASYLTVNYDENLMENIFFQTLQKDFCELFFKAISEGCIICVPRTGSLPRHLLTLEDFLTHILAPTDELPESHFRNLCGAEVKILNRVINIDLESGRQTCVRILFQETFYTSECLKYEVLCVEHPFDGGTNFSQNRKNTLPRNLRDCLDLLWVESETHECIESIDRELGDFLKKTCNDSNRLNSVTSSVNSLYARCLQILLKNPVIRRKYKVEKDPLRNLEVAVEAYIQHGIYKKIMRDISAAAAHDDARLNKIIRNCSNLNFRDFNIKTEFYTSVPKARVELSRINGYSTSLGKIGCLRRTVSALAEPQEHKSALSADDLLQLLAFLIIKTNLPNWNAQLRFLKVFQFSEFSNLDENNFLITSLEAAIAYVQSGIFYKADGESSHETFKSDSEKMSLKEKMLHNFFHQIALGDLDKVKDALKSGDGKICDYGSLNLCHPLCACERCSSVINKNLCEGFITAKSSDDKGLTALHVAAMYGVPNVVEYLLANEADPSAADHDGRTPLHYAALRGHQNALLLLIHNNAEINALDNSSNSSLHLCVNNGHESCVKALIYFSEYLGVKLQINQKNIRGDTPLHNASKWGYLNIVKILLEHGADPEILNKRKFSPINYALNEKVASLLKQKSHRVTNFIKIKPLNPALDLYDQGDKSQNQVFKGVQANSVDAMRKVEKVLKAVENGDVNLVCFYLGIDASDFERPRDVISPPGETSLEEKCHPLCVCVKCEVNGVDKTPNGFLSPRKKGLNINACNSEGYTPLHVASKHGRLDLVRGFVRNGALLNAQTSKLLTPLMLACQSQCSKIVKELLEAGCQTDLQDHKLNTALHHACQAGSAKVVEILLKYEPDISLKNSENKTAMSIAKEKLCLGIIQVLKGGKSLDLNEF